MFKRTMQSSLSQLATQYPVVTMIGPRQSGKTTLVKATYPDMPYVNLERPDVRAVAEADPRAFLNQYSDGVIIDEVQRLPDLLSYIQVIVDETQRAGQFILTGSQQLGLHQAITQSLAGRTGLLNLLPLTTAELESAGISLTIDEYLYQGFYPRLYQKQEYNPTMLYGDYVKTYVERDVRQLINLKDLAQFQRFMKLLAGRVGQILNINDLCNNLGIAHHTASHWLSVLEASFLIFRLPPYFENLGKRIIKSPKLYFTDVGLAAYLLGINDVRQIEAHPTRGYLFENLVVLDTIKSRYNQAQDPNCYFYRDSNQNEVDLLMTIANGFVPIEIKSSTTFDKRFLKGLQYFSGIAKKRVLFSLLVYAGELQQVMQDYDLINYKDVINKLDEKLHALSKL